MQPAGAPSQPPPTQSLQSFTVPGHRVSALFTEVTVGNLRLGIGLDITGGVRVVRR